MEISAKVCYNIWKTIIGELYPLENSLFPRISGETAPLHLKGFSHYHV